MPNKFFEYSACGKPILSTPIPDIMKIGGENLFIYRDKEEFVEEIKKIMDNPRTYRIDVEKYSWNRIIIIMFQQFVDRENELYL